jgi:hypothetical protein
MFGKIKITEFGKRHFDTKFGGTKITDISPEDFEGELNYCLSDSSDVKVKIMDGYAPFCKLIAIPNFTNARVGSLPITIANHQYIRHGYSSRTEKELPVMSRWFELPLPSIIAEYLIVVVYSKEQLAKEYVAELDKKTERFIEKLKEEGFVASENDINQFKELEKFNFDADWGVVAILGQTHDGEEPMQPVTMMRNALGVEEGGSGEPLDRKKYLDSVLFWNHNAIVKS